MASHPLIDIYLRQLARQLPPDAVDELADGLIETWHHHQATGLAPADAAIAAIAEFGHPTHITDAFIQHGSARRTARQLLTTGPMVGLCWGTTLITMHAWLWPIPTTARIAFGLVLFATISALAVAAIGQHRYTRTRLAAAAGSMGLISLDTAMLATCALFAPAPAWPIAIAAALSLARLTFSTRTLPRVLAA
jgi:hypothetical protein